jgi:hypothetical protein
MTAIDPFLHDDDLLIGAQLLLAEEAYMFGEGQIRFEVQSVGEPYDYGGFDWVELHGHELFDSGRVPRIVSVRLAALHEALKRARR